MSSQNKLLSSGFVVALVGAIAVVSLAIFQWNLTEREKLKEFEQHRKEEEKGLGSGLEL